MGLRSAIVLLLRSWHIPTPRMHLQTDDPGADSYRVILFRGRLGERPFGRVGHETGGLVFLPSTAGSLSHLMTRL